MNKTDNRTPPSKNFRCCICNKTFKNGYGLANHSKMMHMADEIKKCPYCGVGCKNYRGLSRHIHLSHGKMSKHEIMMAYVTLL